MNRKEITKKLTDILIADRLSDRQYYAKEVTLDYGTRHPTRVDVMQFSPGGVTFTSDIEKGIFTCYEIKSCKEDIYSGSGLNFYGEKNYIVTTMETWKSIQEDMRSGKLSNYIIENYPKSSYFWGVMVAVPSMIVSNNVQQLHAEFENPTPLDSDCSWRMHVIANCRQGYRKRSMNELLFCMLRSKHSWSNIE